MPRKRTPSPEPAAAIQRYTVEYVRFGSRILWVIVDNDWLSPAGDPFIVDEDFGFDDEARAQAEIRAQALNAAL